MDKAEGSPAKRRWRRSVIVTVAVAAMVAAGCSSSKSSNATNATGSSGTASQPASGKSTIHIAGLQGTAAQGGQDFIEGMLIAEKEINSSGGIDGHPVKVDVIQTQGTSEGAVAAYQQAAQDSATIGAFLGATGGIAIRAQSDLVKLPVILANGTDSDVFPVKKYVFANDQGHENSTASLHYAVTTLHAKSVAVLHYNTDFSEQIPGYVQDGCKKFGCTVTDIEAAGATDSQQQLIPLLQKMKNTNPDVYYIESVNPNGMAAAQQLGMFSKPVIAEQWLTVPAIQQACGTNCEGVVFGGHKCTDPSLLPSSDKYVKLCNDYVSLFKASYPGQPFALFSIYGYAAVHTLGEAARRVLSNGHALTRDDVVTQLEGFHGDYQTLLGNLQTSSSNHLLTGQFQEAYVLYTIKASSNGQATWALAPNSDPEVGAVG